MAVQSPTEQRQRLRAVLAGSACVSPANVYDPLSARIAESVGYEIGQLSGSVMSHVVLAAPDMTLLTPTELADQIRRINRVSNLSLVLDADNGYGNALNVKRTVEEVEYAGASAMEIEDTEPIAFGNPAEPKVLVSIDEMAGKLRAALAARRDPSFVIFGRTAGIRAEGIEGAVARSRAYRDAGVDGIVLLGVQSAEQIEAVHDAAGLPLIVGGWRGSLTREELAARGVRLLPQGHLPAAAALKALTAAYLHLYRGGAREGDGMEQAFASAEEIERLVAADAYRDWQRAYMQ